MSAVGQIEPLASAHSSDADAPEPVITGPQFAPSLGRIRHPSDMLKIRAS